MFSFEKLLSYMFHNNIHDISSLSDQIYKGKTIPLQAWTGPEGSRRLRFPDFKTIGTWRW